MKCSQLRRLLYASGWRIHRQCKGSHTIFTHTNRPGERITFPDHGSKEMSKGLAMKILKQAGVAHPN